MSATIQRLIEVMHMYNQMNKSPKEKPNLFIANLNSFISLARSVTLIMQKEFHNAPGFSDWYAVKQEEMKKDKDMKLFVELRNESLKEKSVGKIFYKIELLEDITIPSKEALSWPSFKPNNEGTLALDEDNKFFKINGVPRPEIKYDYSINYLFKQRPETPAKTLCLAHYKKLEKLVKECNEKFSDTKN